MNFNKLFKHKHRFEKVVGWGGRYQEGYHGEGPPPFVASFLIKECRCGVREQTEEEPHEPMEARAAARRFLGI